MKAKDLIKKLKKLKPDTKLVVTNGMGMPAYDYDGQKFAFQLKGRRLEMTREL